MSVDRVILSQRRVKWLGLVIAVKAPGSTEMGVGGGGNSRAYISLSAFQEVFRHKD